jgi:hypothetical protein
MTPHTFSPISETAQILFILDVSTQETQDFQRSDFIEEMMHARNKIARNIFLLPETNRQEIQS